MVQPNSKMEEELKTLVRNNGFVAVFESLKGLVISEYTRSKADFDFLNTLLGKTEAKVEMKTEEKVEEVKAEENANGDEKVVSIFTEAPSVVKKKVLRKK